MDPIVGTRNDLAEAIEFAAEGKAPLEEVNRVLADLGAGKVDGRIVLTDVRTGGDPPPPSKRKNMKGTGPRERRPAGAGYRRGPGEVAGRRVASSRPREGRT